MNVEVGSALTGPRGAFMRSVGVLAGGAAVGHALTALAMPVLSRLYSPADFSVLAVFTSLVSIFGVAGGLRFDIAVSMAEDDREATSLLALAIVCAAALGCVLLIFALEFPAKLASWTGHTEIVNVLWLLPLAVVFAVSASALQGWFVRRSRFGLISKSRIAQSAASSGAQISLGLIAPSPFGLAVGAMLNSGAASVMLAARWFFKEHALLRTLSWSQMRAVAVKYRRFPKYSTLEALSNSAAIQLPILMIASFAVGPEAGYLSMAIYALQAPMALIGTAIGQTYLSAAPEKHRQRLLGAFTVDVLGGLVKAGVGPLLFAGIVAPVAFGYVFGAEWRRTGELVSWMTPWFLFQFLSTPISMSLHVTGNQRAAMVLQFFGLATRVVAVGASAAFNVSWICEAYALSGFVIYLGYFIVICIVLRIPTVTVLGCFTSATKTVTLWLVLAAIGRTVFALLPVAS